MSEQGKKPVIWDPGDVTWMNQAACAELPVDIVNRWFFSDEMHSREWRNAVAVCGGCGVREQCLAFALNHPDSMPGIFGGETEGARKKLRREMYGRGTPGRRLVVSVSA